MVTYQSWCTKGSILGPLFFLIYNNDLSDELVSTVKLFADKTSLFSVKHDSNISAYELNSDIQKIFEWSYKWKMSFNFDLNKQAQEVIFSRKLNKSSHLNIFFNNAPVFCAMAKTFRNAFRWDLKFQSSY